MADPEEVAAGLVEGATVSGVGTTAAEAAEERRVLTSFFNS